LKVLIEQEDSGISCDFWYSRIPMVSRIFGGSYRILGFSMENIKSNSDFPQKTLEKH
jgi:hypothetical protein